MHDMHHMPENDHEAAMARADLYKLAQYSAKLFKMIQEGQQLEGWVQAKITKSADYIASVYHFMAYEMKVSEYGEALENAEVYENDLRGLLQQRLVEAKEKVKALKKVDAMKHKRHKTDKELEEMRQLANEEKSSTGGEIDRSKPGKTKHTQNPDRFSDEPHTEPKSQAKSQSAADREKDKAADRAEDKEGKNYEKRFPGSVTRVKDGQKVKEGSLPMTTVNGKKVPAFAADGKGKNDLGKGKAAPKKGVNPFAKVKENTAPMATAPMATTSAPRQKKVYDDALRKVLAIRYTTSGEGNPKLTAELKELDAKHLDYLGKVALARAMGGARAKTDPAYTNLENTADLEYKKGLEMLVQRYGRVQEDDTDKKAGPKKGVNPFAKKTNEALKGGQKKLDTDDDNDIDAKDLATLRAKKKDRIKEAVAAKCNKSNKSKSCPVHGMKDCSTAKTNTR